MAIRVLLVDHHALIREGLKLLLATQEDLEVVGEAGDGESTLAAVAALTPDIAVIDLALPDRSGTDIAAAIQRISPRTRVIILTMFVSREYLKAALAAGCLGYVSKERAAHELFTAIRMVQDGNYYLCGKCLQVMVDALVNSETPASPDAQLACLSAREREILQLVTQGKSSKEIAELLCLSPKTVDTYRHRTMTKLNIHDLAGLIRFSVQHQAAIARY